MPRAGWALLGLTMTASACTTTPSVPCVQYPSDLDFGEPSIGAVVRRQLVFTNPNSTPVRVEVSNPRAPFSTTIIGGLPVLFIPSHDSARVELAFTALDALLHVDTLTVTTSPDVCAHPIELRALAEGQLQATTPLDFGAVPLGTTAVLSVTLTNSRRVPLDLTVDDSLAGPFVVTPPAVFSIAAGATLMVPVSFSPQLAGPVTGSLFFKSNRLDQVGVALRAEGGTPRWDAPATVDLGEIPVATTPQPLLERGLSIANTGTGTLRFASFQVEATAGLDAELTVERADEVRAGELGAIALRVRPAVVEGPRAWTLSLETNDPDRPTLTIAVRANVSLRTPCSTEVVLETVVTSSAPVMTEGRLVHIGTTPCFVDGPRLIDAPAGWSLTGPGANGWFEFAPQSTLPLPLSLPTPGAGTVEFQAFGFEPHHVPISAL